LNIFPDKAEDPQHTYEHYNIANLKMTHITDDLGPNPAGYRTEHLYEKSQFHTATTETEIRRCWSVSLELDVW
jgi:hypothetical protein